MRTRIARLIHAAPDELGAALTGFGLFFCLFCGYFMLRPIRETMGIQGGVQNLQWLFTATFVAMLLVVPLHGWLSAHVPRAKFVDWVYGFFALNLVVFAVAFRMNADDVWLARVFYVWLSVYNLFVISVAWSVMADAFDGEQARRLFAFIAAGASAGGLIGPTLGGLLIGVLGTSGLVGIAAVLLVLAVVAKTRLMHWRVVGGAGRPTAIASAPDDATRPVAGNPFAGFTLLLRSPYLLGISAFVLLLATTSTFLYFEQARLVAETFTDRAERVRVFSTIDVIVQTLAILSQLFLTGRVARRLGVRSLLTVVPVLVGLGFVALAMVPTFAVLAVVMVVRRAGEYAFVRPGREMLFTDVDAGVKYRAKNFIDTVVYRGGDAVSGWAKALIDSLGSAVFVALIGAVVAAVWAGMGYVLGRRHDRGLRRSRRGASPHDPHLSREAGP
ncbi:MAG: MFS transporter [Burkholderiales bacterium]|nr:MFS transporter [Burkholderiales bacterium]